MSVAVELITRAEDLSQADIETWNALAANPFQRWQWLGSWWHAYQGHHLLYVLSVRRDDEIIAFAPWFLENRVTTGRTIQFLGSGKASTDHLSLLVRPEDTAQVGDAIARWLRDATRTGTDLPRHLVWDAMELIGIDATDGPINGWVKSMQDLGLAVDQSESMGCYVIDLPDQWDDYVKLRSKSGRREIRQSLKQIDNGVITVKRVHNEQELDKFWNHFVTLHQRRRHASGTTGCFDHPPFGSFLRTAASSLLDAGLLELVIAFADDVPVAAQFALVDDDCWYFYQSGMDPDSAHLRPGLGVFCHAIRSTIKSGRRRFDMMRGDESYKQRWRAKLQPAQKIRVCSPRTAAQLRNQVYSTGVTFKNLVNSSVGLFQRSE
jgi:CelD/BcsL family acetyltransferase involved in cellulose biosynthesis